MTTVNRFQNSNTKRSYNNTNAHTTGFKTVTTLTITPLSRPSFPHQSLTLFKHVPSQNQNLTFPCKQNHGNCNIIQQDQITTETFIPASNLTDFPQPGSRKFRQINNELISAGETKFSTNQIPTNKTISQSNQTNQPKQLDHSPYVNMSTTSSSGNKRKGAFPRFVFSILFNLSHPKQFIWLKCPYLSFGLPARPFE